MGSVVGAWLLFMEGPKLQPTLSPLTRRSGHAVRADKFTMPALTGSLRLSRELLNMAGPRFWYLSTTRELPVADCLHIPNGRLFQVEDGHFQQKSTLRHSSGMA